MPAVVIGLSVLLAAVAGGCGAIPAGGQVSGALVLSDCDGDAKQTQAELVLLRWDGGLTPLYPQTSFAGLDLSAFAVEGGGTLADEADLFKEQVQQQINRVYCESAAPKVRVQPFDESSPPGVTTVFLTQALSPASAFQIGEGEFDRCNQQHDNVALIFGEQIRSLSGDYSFDEWVMLFANVTAHEIGHMLGYSHVPRAEYAPSARALFVELMLDGHTMEELRRQQRLVSNQTNCPSTSPALLRGNEYPVITCGIVE